MKETRIGILGNVDSGKSTIISVLKEKILDNGRGLAMTNLIVQNYFETVCVYDLTDNVSQCETA